MRTLFRVGIKLAIGGLVLAGVLSFWAYRASQHVPEFYQRALKADPARQVEASDRMVQQALDLTCEVRESGHWEALFTAEQLNGWLAVDLVQNHPKLLPNTVSDPRVAITKEGIQLGCKYKSEHLSTVCSLHVEPTLSEPNVVALRVRSAKAGNLPLPLHEILDGITQAAAGTDVHLRWRKEGDDPVALVTIPLPRSEHDVNIRLTKMELRDGAIFLAGETFAHGQDAPAVGQAAEKEHVQR
jgi:uncharacterized protein YpmS